jgi:hypothetical protein
MSKLYLIYCLEDCRVVIKISKTVRFEFEVVIFGLLHTTEYFLKTTLGSAHLHAEEFDVSCCLLISHKLTISVLVALVQLKS